MEWVLDCIYGFVCYSNLNVYCRVECYVYLESVLWFLGSDGLRD